MTSAISTFLESLAPWSAGVGLLLSGSRPAEGKGAPPPTAPMPPADSEMGATAAAGPSASNATSAKRSAPGIPLPSTTPVPVSPLLLPGASRGASYVRTFRAVAERIQC